MWCNAGHNSALLVRAGGGIERLVASGPPLGALPGASYRAHEIALGPGDLLVVYTDGITEAAAPDDEEFGIDRLQEIAQRHCAASLADLRREIEQALHGFVRGNPYADDRTLLFFRRLEAS